MNKGGNSWLDPFIPRPKRIVIFIFVTVIVVIIIMYFLSWQDRSLSHSLLWRNRLGYDANSLPIFSSNEVVSIEEKLVHLDLKGAPPKVAYFEKLFPLLAQLGATGLLVEYEDMFPYQGLLRNISAHNAYSLNDIRTILKYAEKSKLAVIPLIQTFGHLELILKLKEFEELREVPDYPQAVCPTNKATLPLIMDMVNQIIEAHPTITMIHIGADEVFFIGSCAQCVNTMNKFSWTKNDLFLEHVRAVAQQINSKRPNLRILMWDDEFRGMSSRELKASHISSLVEPVVWKYSKDVYEDLGPDLWDMYASVFPKIWIASAFKGATGSDQYVTDTTHHLQNHRSWMSIVAEYEHQIKFQGIFITGWQRYDHFAILCELLPVGLPSLAMSLRLLLGYNDSPLSPPTAVAKILQCEQPYGLIGPTFGLPKCSFPGGEVLDLILRMHQLEEEYTQMMQDSRVKGWMSDYNIVHQYSNPHYVETATLLLPSLRIELAQLEVDLTLAMQEVYDNYTIAEWIETYLKPLSSKVQKLWTARENLLAKTVWPRRPLSDYPEEL